MRGVCAALLAGAIVLAGAGGAAGSSPSAPTFAFTVSQVSAGESHTCAVTGADVLQCWGLGTDGQIGPTSAGRPFPTFVANGIRSVSAGFQHTCAVTTAGAAECFGANGSGQLGDGSTNPNANPHQVTSLGSGVRVVSAASPR